MAAGAEVASAFVTLVPSAKGFAGKIDREIGPDLDRSGKQSGKRFGGALGASAAAPIAAGLTGLGIVSKLGGFVADARESAKIGALTAQVIKTTGGAAGVTAKQVGDLATAISNKTGADDEAIQSASNLLLTFTGVRNEVGKGNDVFNQATGLALDMSTVLGTDAKSAALQLGKALNDPTKGIAALSRSGVSFTAQQKEQIKTLQASGDTLGAQKIILAELGKEFGGAAAAAGTPADKLRTSVGNLGESIGAFLIPALDRSAVFLTTRVIPALTSAGSFVRENATTFKVLGAVVGVLAVAFVAYSTTVKIVSAVTRAYAAVQTLLNGAMALNPIGLVVVALIALGAGLVLAYKKSETFRRIVDSAFAAVRRVVEVALPVVRRVVAAVFGFIARYVGDVIGGFVRVIKGGVNIVVGLFTGDFGRVKQGVSQALGGVLQLVTALPRRILSALGKLGGLLLGSGKDIVGGMIRGIKAKAGDLIATIKSTITDKLPGFVKKALGIRSPSRVFMELGLQTGAGMALGLNRSAGTVEAAAAGLVPSPRTPSFPTSSGALTPGAGLSRGGDTYNIYPRSVGDEQQAQTTVRSLRNLAYVTGGL